MVENLNIYVVVYLNYKLFLGLVLNCLFEQRHGCKMVPYVIIQFFLIIGDLSRSKFPAPSTSSTSDFTSNPAVPVARNLQL